MRLHLSLLIIALSLPLFSEAQDDDYRMFSIYFGGGSHYVTEEQAKELYEFIGEIKDIENYSISIHSHTDNIGPAEWNKWLSEMRGDAAIELLVQYNIFREVITKKDFGLYNPVYDNSTWWGRRMNRRVDIIFWPVVM